MERTSEPFFREGDRLRVFLSPTPPGYGLQSETGFFRGIKVDDLNRPVALWLEVEGEQVELGVPPNPLDIAVNWDRVLYVARLT